MSNRHRFRVTADSIWFSDGKRKALLLRAAVENPDPQSRHQQLGTTLTVDGGAGGSGGRRSYREESISGGTFAVEE